MRALLFFLLLLPFQMGFAKVQTLRERLLHAQGGDYVVTQQGAQTTVLLIRTLEPPLLQLEEISLPSSDGESIKSWKEWVAQKAPGHTSWVTYAIDLEKNALRHSYSHSQRQWLFIDKSDYFLVSLFTLPLQPTQEQERKRVGPPPSSGEADLRKLWLPPLMKDGKKQENPRFDILRAQWPKDESRLAGCTIEVYLDGTPGHFPFPYWLEVQSPHYTFKMRALDSGQGMLSPMPVMNNFPSPLKNP